MHQVADQANADKRETLYALERYSSRMASILIPPFVKKKLKRNKRSNERGFQRKKLCQEK
jgi:hypothetical protein